MLLIWANPKNADIWEFWFWVDKDCSLYNLVDMIAMSKFLMTTLKAFLIHQHQMWNGKEFHIIDYVWITWRTNGHQRVTLKVECHELITLHFQISVHQTSTRLFTRRPSCKGVDNNNIIIIHIIIGPTQILPPFNLNYLFQLYDEFGHFIFQFNNAQLWEYNNTRLWKFYIFQE